MGDTKRLPAAIGGRALILSSSAIERCWHGTCSCSIHSHRRTTYASTSMAGIQGPACVGGSTFRFVSVDGRSEPVMPRLGTVQHRHPQSYFAVGACASSMESRRPASRKTNRNIAAGGRPSIHGRPLLMEADLGDGRDGGIARCAGCNPTFPMGRGWRPAVVGTGGIQEDRVPGASDRYSVSRQGV